MGNIDGKSLFGLLSRIESIKAEISALESELKSLVPSSDLDEDFGTQTSEPIDITIPDIDMGIGLDAPVLSVPAMAGEEADLKEEAVAAAEDIQEASAAEPEVQDIPEVTEAEGFPAMEDIPEAEDAGLPAMEDIPEEPEATAEVEDIPAETGAEPAEVTPVREMAEPTEGTAQAEKTAPAAETEEDDLPFFDEVPARPVKKKTSSESGRKAIVDSITADAAVMDVMAEQQAWRTDRAGSPVKNVISAISLNDRVLLINILFKEDPLLFQDTIAAFNSMSGFEEAVTYVKQHFPEWDLNSDPVYRLMMAVRRKFS